MPVVRRIPVIAAFWLTLLCAAQPFANQTEERLCTVKGVVGTAKVRLSPHYDKVRREVAAGPAQSAVRAPGGVTREWSELRLGMVVGEHCEIMTSAQSEVRLETAEGSVIRISESTHAEIVIMRAVRQKVRVSGGTETVTAVSTKFRIIDGSVAASIKKLLSAKTDVRFETPTATAAIRGTVVEIEAKKGAATVIRAFDGTVFVAPLGSKRFVELKDGDMTEIAPKQKAIIVRRVPGDYKRKGVYLKGEADPAKETRADSKKPAKAEVAAVEPESVAVRLRLDLGGSPEDTINCYAGDSIIIEGAVSPASAKVNVNGLEAVPGRDGAFRLAFRAPADSGAFALRVTAESDTLAETAVRMVNVAHVYTEVKLVTPAEGTAVSKPSVLVSGTAEPGSKVNVLGVTLNAKRDGTFSGEAGLPPDTKEGSVKVRVEIVSPDNSAVWIERNIRYKIKH